MREHTNGPKTMTNLITNNTWSLSSQIGSDFCFILYYIILYYILYTLTELLKMGISLDLYQES